MSLSLSAAFGGSGHFHCPLCNDPTVFDTPGLLDHLRVSHQAQAVRCNSQGSFPLRLTANSDNIVEKSVYVAAVVKMSGSSSIKAGLEPKSPSVFHTNNVDEIAMYGVRVRKVGGGGGGGAVSSPPRMVANVSVLMINPIERTPKTPACGVDLFARTEDRETVDGWLVACEHAGRTTNFHPHMTRNVFINALEQGLDMSVPLNVEQGKVLIDIKAQISREQQWGGETKLSMSQTTSSSSSSSSIHHHTTDNSSSSSSPSSSGKTKLGRMVENQVYDDDDSERGTIRSSSSPLPPPMSSPRGEASPRRRLATLTIL